MKRTHRAAFLLALWLPAAWPADDASWNKVRYSGGSVEAKVNPFDFNTTVTVGAGVIALRVNSREALRLKPSQVTALSYGREAKRRVGDFVALGLVVTPLALFGLLHKSTQHFVGIEYKLDDGKPGAVLLEVDKGSYRAMLKALKGATGKPVRNEP